MRVCCPLLVFALGGCFSARVAVGPTVDTDGNVGAQLRAGFGIGYSWRRDRGLFITPNLGGGVSTRDIVRAPIVTAVDYVAFSETSARRDPTRVSGWRVGWRQGVLLAEELPIFVGAAAAWLPWASREFVDRSLGEKAGKLGPHLWGYTARGIELEIVYVLDNEALFESGRERTYPEHLQLGLSYVWEWLWLVDD